MPEMYFNDAGQKSGCRNPAPPIWIYVPDLKSAFATFARNSWPR